jgi:hypothetical protein
MPYLKCPRCRLLLSSAEAYSTCPWCLERLRVASQPFHSARAYRLLARGEQRLAEAEDRSRGDAPPPRHAGPEP